MMDKLSTQTIGDADTIVPQRLRISNGGTITDYDSRRPLGIYYYPRVIEPIIVTGGSIDNGKHTIEIGKDTQYLTWDKAKGEWVDVEYDTILIIRRR